MKIDRMRVFMTRDKDRPRVIVALDTDDGLTGWGECYNHGPDKALPPLLDYLYEFLSGQDPTRVDYLVNLLIQQSRFPPGALGLAAISALDHCLWDLAAKAANVPVYKLLGGEVRDRIKVYAGVYTAPDAPAARDEFDRLKEGWGFTAFKLSPWRLDMHAHRWGNVVKASADYFRSLRETVNDEYEIAFDAHAKIFEPIAARQLGNALAPYDPLFYEEPLRPENIEAWGDLKQGLNCVLATGESLYNRNEFLRLLQVKGADLIQPDICVVGGISEMRRIATLAEAFFVGVAPHNPMGPLATAVNVHFSAAAQNFRILEYRLPKGQAYVYGGIDIEKRQGETRYVVDPYLPKDGYLELRPDRPGWGVEMDEKAMEEEGYIHWQRRVPKRPDGSYAFA
ncbi:mandelate racemase/muconate lactonizing enzyme family protein (plasmid) [Rhizobium ruizarguesonis]|jgi:L-alanine-DL-glutamate epimerase-like enolase superfamily enzyme|uniref:Mandelate racemase/muconate lactonizing enzyme family protein n=1 Tax=Rhizobium ruizarguesonis TaxID=2081791 RepID=A0AAE5C1H1_9HYPH|nr:galactarate dehydratase [Rhizobium ruizarguesonis]MBY5829623.1 mandelate racemase/muconate lactonizing enzyme family protein [Rhizobium leguminosarum]NKK55810.1 mandelate racemase/muconate lactonizing enzyme family protein [Rhizobium leguminosarum bv. viciae]QIO48002.1 mandelate racemase/muconate lactonizing enzyme family protein [Rhizobium leguminosarum bv. trifolii]MBC2808817.1 mandelate racemase/muconate lactonizing enzyme family protein [Rhizobium ruizarguesonis]MBY5850706.1 mandelate r